MRVSPGKSAHKVATIQTRHPRRGLAPLEMILCMPFLLLIMVAIVNFSTAAAWKLRSLSVGRYAAHLSRWPRMARNSQFTSADWLAVQTVTLAKQFPEPYTLDSSHGSDRYLGLTDPRDGHIVVDGPSIPPSSAFGGSGTGLTVNDGLLDFSAGIWDGITNLERSFPFRSPIPDRASFASSYAFNNLRSPVIENQLEFHRMGLDHNSDRRSGRMFYLDENYSPRNDGAVSTSESLISVNRTLFDSLEHDWELIAYNQAIMADPMSTKPLAEYYFYPHLGTPNCGYDPICTDPLCISAYSSATDTRITRHINGNPNNPNATNGILNIKRRMQTEFDKLYQ